MIAKKEGADGPGQQGNRLGYVMLVVALLALAIAGILIFQPFFVPLLLALIFTSVFYPLYAFIRERFGEERTSLASGVSCALIVLLVLVPISWIFAQLAAQVPDAVRGIRVNARKVVEKFEQSSLKDPLERAVGAEEFERFVRRLKQSLQEKVGDQVEDKIEKELPGGGEESRLRLPKNWLGIAGSLTSLAAKILSGLIGTIVKAAIMVFFMFYFFRDGPQMLESIKVALPVKREHQDRIATTFKQISRSLLKGTVLTAVIQGIVAGIVFLVVGIPALIGGFGVALAALVPFLGTGLVTVPVTLYLFAQEMYWQAIVMVIVAAIIAALDNFLRPLLMQEGLSLHPVWIFIALLGGATFFGPIGLLLGPMVVVLLRTFLAVVSEESKKSDSSIPNPLSDASA